MDHDKIPSLARPAYGGVNRKTDVKHDLERREKERSVSLCISESLRQMTEQDRNSLPLRALKSTSANVGGTSRDKFQRAQ